MPEEKQPNGKNSQKTVAIALYILIAVIVIAVGVYWWMTKDEATTTTTNNSTNTTANNEDEAVIVDYTYEGWQDYEYINEADAMSILMKYPEDWVVASESDEGESFFVDFTSDSNAQAPLEMEANNFWVHATKIVFTGNNATGVVSNNPDYFDEIFATDKGDIIENSLYGDITKIDDDQILGRPAVIYSVEAIPNSDAGPAYNYAVKDGTDIYRIGFMNISAKKASDLNDDKSLFDQMAASFMITDIAEEETDKSSQNGTTKSYSINNYTFDIPTNWIAEEPIISTGPYNETKANFTNEEGNKVAEINCPIVTTGYEQHEKIGIKTEDYTKSNNTYNKELSFGESLSQDVEPFSLVLMRKKGTTDLIDTDSCQLFSDLDWENDSAVKTTFTAIYESVE